MRKSLLVICSIVMILTGCESISTELTEQQRTCDHQWNIVKKYLFIDHGERCYTIYCPKCKLEKKHVNEEKWNELQLDMEYKNE